MKLEELITNFIEGLEGQLKVSHSRAKEITKNALLNQIQKSNQVSFEHNGKDYKFSKEEFKTAWKNIK